MSIRKTKRLHKRVTPGKRQTRQVDSMVDSTHACALPLALRFSLTLLAVSLLNSGAVGWLVWVLPHFLMVLSEVNAYCTQRGVWWPIAGCLRPFRSELAGSVRMCWRTHAQRLIIAAHSGTRSQAEDALQHLASCHHRMAAGRWCRDP